MNAFLYISAIFVYFIVGLVWGYLQWTKYVGREVEYYEQEKQKYLVLNRIKGIDIPAFLVFEWRNYVKGVSRLKAVPPKAIDFRGEITYDVVCWPIAMTLALLIMLYNISSQRVLAEYNKVTNHKIEKIRKDLG